MRKKANYIEQDVTLDHNGRTYRAKYHVEKDVVFVTIMTRDGVTISPRTQIGGSTALCVARILLGELVEAGNIEPE